MWIDVDRGKNLDFLVDITNGWLSSNAAGLNFKLLNYYCAGFDLKGLSFLAKITDIPIKINKNLYSALKIPTYRHSRPLSSGRQKKCTTTT